MCYIDAYEREHQSSSCDDGSSGGGFPLPKKQEEEDKINRKLTEANQEWCD